MIMKTNEKVFDEKEYNAMKAMKATNARDVFIVIFISCGIVSYITYNAWVVDGLFPSLIHHYVWLVMTVIPSFIGLSFLMSYVFPIDDIKDKGEENAK